MTTGHQIELMLERRYLMKGEMEETDRFGVHGIRRWSQVPQRGDFIVFIIDGELAMAEVTRVVWDIPAKGQINDTSTVRLYLGEPKVAQ